MLANSYPLTLPRHYCRFRVPPGKPLLRQIKKGEPKLGSNCAPRSNEIIIYGRFGRICPSSSRDLRGLWRRWRLPDRHKAVKLIWCRNARCRSTFQKVKAKLNGAREGRIKEKENQLQPPSQQQQSEKPTIKAPSARSSQH
jgi:hypothetical protein